MLLNEYFALVRDKMLPFQWLAINDQLPDAEKSGAIRNLEIAAGRKSGAFYGTMWQDSDVYKWLEASCAILRREEDAALSEHVEWVVQLLLDAQLEDGYLQTYFMLKEPDARFADIEEGHELYCMGHFIEAAVAHHQATGDRRLLHAAQRMADLLDRTFGPEDDKIHGYPGHECIELALMRLYHETGETRYVDLADYMVRARGTTPNFFLEERKREDFVRRWPDVQPMTYFQAHKPVIEQRTARGHAVRALYLYTGMAMIAKETKDAQLIEACERLFRAVTCRQMYITGASGSSARDEAFTEDYHLPNDRAYAETCATVALVFFAKQMLALRPEDTRIGDVMERAIYNGVLSSFGLRADQFFYVNPQEGRLSVSGAGPGSGDPALRHVRLRRNPWHGCSCCPPNAARLLASIDDYAFMWAGETLYCTMILPGSWRLAGNGGSLRLRWSGDYPWSGDVALQVEAIDGQPPAEICVRVPGWADPAGVSFEGEGASMSGGFIRWTGARAAGARLTIHFPMEIRLTRANPRVAEDIGRVAIERGPLVYCLEGCDHGFDVFSMVLPRSALGRMTARWSDSLQGMMTITGPALSVSTANWPEDQLYGNQEIQYDEVQFTAIPYFLWANREKGDLLIWIHEGQ